MANRTGEKNFWLNITIVIISMTVLVTFITDTTEAKPLYVIADMKGYPTPIHVYDIAADGSLTFQDEFSIPHYIRRAENLTIDSDSNFLFATFEHGDMIHFIDATALQYKNHIAVSGFPDLAGIVFDHDKGLVYCAYRNTDTLFVHTWDAGSLAMNPAAHSPATLTGATAYGIALDEINDLLYVANKSNKIKVYHTSDWSLKETISVSHTAMSIAVDAMRDFVYTGGVDVSNQYLTQYNLNTRKETNVQVEADAGVFGIAVDQSTGFIYVSTGNVYATGGDNLKTYNTSLKQIGVITDVENPTGIAIPFDSKSYNPLNLYKNIAGSSADKIEQVDVGSAITYTISFDNKNNDYAVNNVTIVDKLPKEISFITVDGDGVFGHYDPVTHTYTWTYPSLPSGFSDGFLTLVAQVNQVVAPGTTITNSVTLDSDETEPVTSSVNAVIKATNVSSGSLNLSKNVIGGTFQQNAISKETSVTAGDTIIYGICFDNKDNEYTINNISIVDTLPDELSFVTADGDGVFGQYNPLKHTYTWTYPSLPSGATGDCLQLVVQVNNSVIPSTTVTNFVTIDSDETEPETAHIDVVTTATSSNQLNLSKVIMDSTFSQTDIGTLDGADLGDTIIYGICFDNKDSDSQVNNVSIVDTLSDELSFVTADGDGVFGQYDPVAHTYTWTYPSLSPRSPGDCLQLVVQVNKNAIPGMTITNSVTINSKETGPTTASVDYVVSKVIPVADAGPDQRVLQGTEVTLDGSGSTNTNFDIVSYDWYEEAVFIGSGLLIKHTFPLGVHAITLVVTDSSGQTYSDDVIINVVSNIKEFFTEMFSSYNFDLSYKAIMFTPTADGTSYDACLQDITQLPTDPVGGTRMVMTDDSYKLVSLKNQKTVSIFGSRVSDLYICSNGYITFTEADISDSVSLSHHFAAKRISCLLNNLNFLDDSTVDYQQLEDRVVVTWISVPLSGLNYYNTFQVEMYFDGRIQLAWLWIAVEECIVGLSNGLGLPADFQQTGFSEYPTCDVEMPKPVPPVIPVITPIACWTMDDKAADTTVLDTSGKGNHGTAQRNTSALSVAGQINSALTFNGINDYISVPDSDEWTFGDFTITLWAKFDTFNPKWWEAAFLGHDEGPGNNNKWIFAYDSAGDKTLFHIVNMNTDCQNCGPIVSTHIKGDTWNAQAGLWYFIAVTRSGNIYTFYRDGVTDGSQIDGTVIPNANSPLTVGWAEEYATFDGALDDVTIHDRALTGAEITALYNEGAGQL